MKKILIAMSGGVDSGVAAALIQKAGYECLGAMMRLHKDSDAGASSQDTNISDAKAIADSLGIPFHVLDLSREFEREVIDRFISAYEMGATPNPCVDCNRHVKFGALIERASELDCDTLATGHYARIEYDAASGRYLLKKALDTAKDQSYMLYSLSQEQLSHTIFPLGELTKDQARAMAEKLGLAVAHKKDSQDICFVPNGDYASVISSYTGKEYESGKFVDTSGKILGEHKGIIHYTVGQRKGLGLALPEPLYVKELDICNNNVVLAKNDELFSRHLDANDFNWSAIDCPAGAIRAKVKVRYRHDEQWATVTPTSPTTVHIEFDEPVRAITRGQSAVAYDGDTVLGGGKII